MANAMILAAVGVPFFIIFIVLIVLIYGSRTKIAKMQSDFKDFKAKANSKLETHEEAINGVANWAIAAQVVMQLPGYGPY